jgi:hypothetical protein
VLVCTFESVMAEQALFGKVSWKCCVVDEAHRLKNRESKLSRVLRSFDIGGLCECSCDVHLCSLSCCSFGGASAFVTFICVLCNSVHTNLTINTQRHILFSLQNGRRC